MAKLSACVTAAQLRYAQRKRHVSAIDPEIFGVGHFRDLTKFLTVFLCKVSTFESTMTTALGAALGVAVTMTPEKGQSRLR